MSFAFRGSRGDIESGFPGLVHERPSMRLHAHRPVNSNSLAFLVTVLLMFMVLNSHQMSSNFMLWLVVSVFLLATSLRMYVTCQQLRAQARAHAAAASGLLGHTELRVHMPPPIAFATRGGLQGLRLQLALLDHEFDDLDYDALRALDSENASAVPSMSDEEINALPVHKYKATGSQSDTSSRQQVPSSSGSSEVMQDSKAPAGSAISSDDDLTCTICLEQVNKGELVRSLPCLHQVFPPLDSTRIASTHGFDNRGHVQYASLRWDHGRKAGTANRMDQTWSNQLRHELSNLGACPHSLNINL